ncbi:hypothetical protein AVENLUH5627_02777 [Acinetobacter venetianus]|uniref:Uncharacterized protein n=1 Tax=Acinetobacter venetianus TaxID=52133 RepID=A0A150HM18_9GAMM|nr:hypothetical protein [Acinetobacter venetianus]KXZ65487.1 hypothetical protein AVENLUH5627_02777 [Acinetobacter venetianus]
MKYYRNTQTDLIHAFEQDGSQDSLITEDFIQLTAEETDKLLNPERYLSDEEKEQIHLSSFPSLTRRQFKLALLDNDLLNTVEASIETIKDPIMKQRVQIEYSESERFERSNEAVQFMLGILNIPLSKVDEMWSSATKF